MDSWWGMPSYMHLGLHVLKRDTVQREAHVWSGALEKKPVQKKTSPHQLNKYSSSWMSPSLYDQDKQMFPYMCRCSCVPYLEFYLCLVSSHPVLKPG